MNTRPADGPYVFLSYASADRDRALAIADKLEAAGIAVWIDRQAIAGGASWGTEIVEAIERATVVVVCCTAASLASRNVRQELQIAWRNERAYLPLRLEAVDLPREVQYFLEGCQWVEVLDRPEAEWAPEMLRALARLGVTAATETRDREAARPEAPTNMPRPATDCLGREREIAEIRDLLRQGRLVTLTGPGGIGKTRLAIEVAAGLLEEFPDGVYFVDLAPLTDPAMVLPAIGAALDARETADQRMAAAIAERLRKQRVLLVVDNFEQVVAAAADLSELLTSTDARILATSQLPLRVQGEYEYPVGPLALGTDGPFDGGPGKSPSVALFAERARQVRPDFALTDANVATIEAICRRLDGLPLAIELAASRVRLLSPEQIAQRLDQQLALLTGGGRDRPGRQQTMSAAVAWSYELLSPGEQRLFRRLAVFAGGFTLEAAEQIVSVEGESVLDGLAALLEHSLVVADRGAEDRYRILEPVRQFAAERLEEDSEEAEKVRSLHADWFQAYARTGSAKMGTAEQAAWIHRLNQEEANIRQALDWATAKGQIQSALRTATSLSFHWWTSGRSNEALVRLENLIAAAVGLEIPPLLQASAALQLGLQAAVHGDVGRAARHLAEAEALFRSLGNRRGLAGTLNLLSAVAIAEDRHDDGMRYAAEALRLGQELNDLLVLRNCIANLSELAADDSETAVAEGLVDEWLRRARAEDDRLGEVAARTNSTRLLLQRGDLTGVAAQLRLALPMLAAFYSHASAKGMLLRRTELALEMGDFRRAARLFGAEAGPNGTSLLRTVPGVNRRYRRSMAAVRGALGDEAFEAEWDIGRKMTPAEVIAYALEGLPE